MNIVVLLGRPTKDPEVRYASDGEKKIVTFTLAVERASAGLQKGAYFFDCKAFGKKAEIIEKWVKKGQKIAITGNLMQEAYTDREGKRHNSVSVAVNDFEFASTKGESAVVQNERPSEEWMSIPTNVDDGIPFN